MLNTDCYTKLLDSYTISKLEFLEHKIVMDSIEQIESNESNLIRKINKDVIGMELSNDEIADNQQLLAEHLKEEAQKLGYEKPFDVIQQLNPKFRIIAVFEMFYKLQIRAIHLMKKADTFLLLSTHDVIKVCEIKNYSMRRAIEAIIEPMTNSYVVKRENYEKSIRAATRGCHETYRASVGVIFNEHKPTLEELNFVMDYLDKRGKAEYVAFNNSMYTEMTEPQKEALLKGKNNPITHIEDDYDEFIGLPDDDDEVEDIVVCDENNEPIDVVYDSPIQLTPDEEKNSPFTPKFKPPVTSTPMDSEDELPF